MKIDLTYEIGETIITESRRYRVIGLEFVEGRGLRYILLHTKEGKCEWEYIW
jgi:hypothetical protein